MSVAELDLGGVVPTGRLVIEASAGTGKTYSLSALVVRHIAEGPLLASELLVVTYTRAAAAELRDRTRRALVLGAAAVADQHVPDDQPWLASLVHADAAARALSLDNLQRAIAAFDDATITTIHGFCQQALKQLGLRSGTSLHTELADSSGELVDEVCRDLVVAALIDHPEALSWPGRPPVTPSKVLADLVGAVKKVIGNPGAVAVPQPDVVSVKKGDSVERLTRWVHVVHDAVAEVEHRRRARQELGYDDLITGLRDAVTHPVHGADVVAALSARYRLVMVDEFQDTDRVQWQILRTAFGGDLITVGDPKQAIYRFRGADVQAYLEATHSQPTLALDTNFRSDADLVAATNSLLGGVQLGDPRIVVGAVKAAPSAPQRALDRGAPLVVRRVPDDPAMQTKAGLSSPLAQRVILDDLVREVVELLDRHTITTRQHGSQRVHPGHIAVLVPSHADADKVMRWLTRAGVPAVRTRTGSVFGTPASRQWSLLLAAMEQPSYAPAVRAAGLGVFLHRSAAELDPQADNADQRLAQLQQLCAQWGHALSTKPFLAWYDEVRASSLLVETLLARRGGERDLTDLDHIAEVLAGELGGLGTTAASARRALDRLIAESADLDDLGPRMRRIDSDAQAVQITTIHGSKGLQYPIVLVPFSFKARSAGSPLVYNDPDGRRVIDIASNQGWKGAPPEHTETGRKHLAEVEQQGDALRLLYVALTRAEHRTVVWWAPLSDSGKSGLNIVLFDRDADGEPRCSAPSLTVGPRGGVKGHVPSARPADDEAADAQLRVLAARSNGLIEVGVCSTTLPPAHWRPAPPVDAAPGLEVADAAGRVLRDPSWSRWSFTSITRTIESQWHEPAAPVVGGNDEPADGPLDPSARRASSPGATTEFAVAMPWAHLAGGTAFGTLVHSVLERLDPTSATLPRDLHDAVWAQLRRDRLPVPPEVVEAGLLAALHTPLGPLTDGKRLVDIPVAHRLAELDFDLPLVGARGRFAAAAFGRVLLDSLSPDDPQRAYAHTLADGRFDIDLGGYLQGSIDAVLRVTVGEAQRFVVVDYKTNRLHALGAASPLDAYHPDRLPAAMADHDYPLQALLYSVALHRYLRWRLAGYDPHTHLGGIAYLFVRGMVGAHTPQHLGVPYGVFSWHPPARTVVALDRLLAEGGVA